jgi:hypothetical protein
MRTTNQRILIILTMLFATACGNSGTSYSILPSSDSFKQASSSFNNQVDLLWVVDNSPSMDPLQNNMTSNFNSFISQFMTKGYDFQMAVTTTDAYLADSQFNNDPSLSKFRDGVGTTHSGVFTILPSTPNLINVFVTNATQGGNGSADERAFSSMRSALNNTAQNGTFHRPTAYLGIIILSDEDDFSSASRPEDSWLFRGGVSDHNYSYSGLDPESMYISYLDTLTASTGATRRYSINAITVKDSACLNAHLPQSPTSIVGQRYMDVASQTNGVVGSICDTSYASTLTAIQQNIVELSTQFFLTKTPDPTTITVAVNGVSILQDSSNGWTYSATSNSITFHGTAVPAEGASISVNFQPTTLSN